MAKPERVCRRRRLAGFTLIELLVVLVILGLLAALVGPQIMSYVGSSKTDAAKLQIEDLSSALDLYRLDVGRYPTSGQGLRALVEKPDGVSGWNGPYLRKNKVPQDPWGQDYIYRQPGNEGRDFDILTHGADGQPGGEGENQDVVSWR